MHAAMGLHAARQLDGLVLQELYRSGSYMSKMTTCMSHRASTGLQALGFLTLQLRPPIRHYWHSVQFNAC